MKSLVSLAFAAVAGLAAFAAPADAVPYCQRHSGAHMCVESLSDSIERLSVRHDDGMWFVADVTCTADTWILHDGWKGSNYITRDIAGSFAKSYCEGRGSMFVSA